VDSGADGYLLDNRAGAAGTRFRAMSELFDPWSFRHLDDLGIAPGWRCWEVGAGGTAVVQWLAGRVGPEGRVLATDIDTSWAEAASGGVVEVRRHDVAGDAPPDELFDLVHARLVLVHVVARDAALASMAAAVRPGGWLVVEDADPALQPRSCIDPQGPEEELANRLRSGFRTLLGRRGVDLAYGRTLPRRLRALGLADVRADAFFPLAHPATVPLELATIGLIRAELVEHGIATDEEVERHLANVASGRLDLAQPRMISAWGRKPA
jgi:SAM-dependent methyltransferase